MACRIWRETPIDKAYRWQAGDRVKQVDVKLPRGVLVRGTVVETGTNIPVAGASIQYIPESKGKPRAAEGVLTGWQGIQISGADGKFQIPVLPGPGRLLVHGPHGKYVLLETSERELSRGQRGGRRNYAHAIERIDPADGADTVEATISIRPGETVTGRIVDQQGVSIDEALIVSRLEIDPKSPFFRGYRAPTLGGRFELAGLDPEQEYPVYFLDPKRKLGAAQVVRAGNTDLNIALAPCGQASARFLDPEGQPQARFSPGLHMIVTPGEIENESIAYMLGKLTADADFVSNIDQVNYLPAPTTDKDGRVTFPALIPGANYQLHTYKDGKQIVLKKFTVQPGETIELGDLTVDLSRG